ncbi:LamG-like jellyroll fold domain-containing protein [Nonomuraea sp. NPDC050556]|uniref:LamG-like jellyroll fold domain-containing protein n=1 Tax=Nonomuraea sp. NPDC050556 TaxID=3364369 RepID=UPI0037A92ABC
MVRIRQWAAAACLLVVASPLSGQQQAMADDGLVAAYGFEGSAADASGNGNNGVTSRTAWVDGKYGRAVALEADDSQVSVKNSPSLQLTTGMTVEAWVNPTGISGSSVSLSKNMSYGLYTSVTPSGTVRIGTTYQSTVPDARPRMPINVWTHLAVTHDGQVLRLYINGALASEKAAPGAIAVSTSPLVFSRSSRVATWKGRLDEVRVYNVALGQDRIQADMATPVVADTALDAPPSAPGGFTAAPVDFGKAALSWQPATDDHAVTGYQVHRSATPGFTPGVLTLLATVTSTSYADKLTAAGAYYYQVRALDTSVQAGPSAPEQRVQVSEPDEPPSAPAGQWVTGHTGWVDVQWDAAWDDRGVTRMEVHRSTQPDFTPSAATLVATPSRDTYSYVETVTEPGTYYYRVRAVDTAGQTGASAITAVQVTAAPDQARTLSAAFGMNEGWGDSASDSSGNGNYLNVSSLFSWTSGKFGRGIAFPDNADTGLGSGHTASLGADTRMTMSAWVYPTVDDGTNSLAIRRWVGAGWLELDPVSSYTGSCAHGYSGSTGNPTCVPTALPLNTWSHVAVSTDGSVIVLYVNGEPVKAGRYSAADLSGATGQLALDGHFRGKVDELRTYSAALTPAQIKADMNTPIG